MKKLVLISATALGFVSAANAQPVDTVNKSGFYLGINGGYSFIKSKEKNGDEHTTIKPKGLIGGFHVGYQHDMGRIVVGVEGSADFTKAHKKKTTKFIETEAPFAGVPFTAIDQVKRKSAYGAALRLGYKVAPCWVAGIKLGYEHNNYEIAYKEVNDRTNATVLSGKDKYKHNGFVPGIYAEKLLNRHWMVGAEYSYAMYKKKTITSSNGDKITHTPRAHDIKVRLGYKF